jgi:hypothetical protein
VAEVAPEAPPEVSAEEEPAEVTSGVTADAGLPAEPEIADVPVADETKGVADVSEDVRPAVPDAAVAEDGVTEDGVTEDGVTEVSDEAGPLPALG